VDSAPDLGYLVREFPLEAAPPPSLRGVSGKKILRVNIIRALYQQYEATTACHTELDRLIRLGRRGDESDKETLT
jgi:hypothetical protein